MSFDALQPFLTAVAIGLLLGMEREWSHRTGARQAAGSRTFALLALCGAIAASFGPWIVAAGLAGTAALLAIGYARTSTADPGLTTEVAAGAAYLLGALAFREAALAVGLAVLVAGLLLSKARLHRLARETVTEVEVEDAVKFLVIAFVVLPLLPDRDLGPFGALNPNRIWRLVVALTGIGWLGYLGVRVLGAQRGLLFTGLAGGFVSASATTAAMARRSGEDLRSSLAAAVAASAATVAQLAAVLALVNAGLLVRLAPSLVLSGAVLLTAAVLIARGSESGTVEDASADRPFALRPALVLAGVLTAALLIARAGAAWFGGKGAILAAGLAGFADAHASSVAAATLAARGEVEPSQALLAIAAALATNTVTKVVLAFVGGGRGFGWRFSATIAAGAATFALGMTFGLD